MEPISDISTNDPRWIRLKPSRLQLAVMLAGASLAIAVLVMIPQLATWLRGVLAAAICLQIIFEVVTPFFRHTAVVAFYFTSLDPGRDEHDGRKKHEEKGDDPQKDASDKVNPSAKLGIRLQLKNGAIQQGEVRDRAFVMPWFATVPYRFPNDGWFRKVWPRTLPLWRDRLEAESFRQVRVQLRWH